MALQIQKKIEVPKEEAAEFPVVEQVDMYATLKAQLAKAEADLKPLKMKVAEFEDTLRTYADGLVDKTEKVSVKGIEHILEFGPKASTVLAIDKEALVEAVTPEVYLDLANMAVGDIRKYCNPKQIEKILTEDNVGKRSIKILA